MKKLIVVLLAFSQSSAFASAYVQGVWTKNNPVYVTGGETFTPSKLKPDAAVTTVAIAYHPLSAGSLWDRPAVSDRMPAWLLPILPRESWACSLGGAWNAKTHAGVVGCGINILDSVRQEASEGLKATGNESLTALGEQIAPGKGPVALYASRVEQLEENAAGHLILAPRWMFAASYGF